MSPVTIGTGYGDQAPITVDALLQNPLVVPELMRNLFRGAFIADQILRPAGRATGGAVQYWVSGPVFPDATAGDVEVVAPLAEIPAVNPIVGLPASAQVLKRGLGLRIARELQDRNNIGAVQRGLQQIRNAIVRSVDGAMMAALRAASTQAVAATAPWGSATGTTIRKDLGAAEVILENLRDQGYDYQPDTLLISRQTRLNLRVSPEFLAPYIGSAASGSPALSGSLPGGQGPFATTSETIWGFNVITAPTVLNGEAWMLQSKVVGGIADERGVPGQPIELSDMFAEPAFEAMRWNVTRAAAGFIDNPLAAVRLTGV